MAGVVFLQPAPLAGERAGGGGLVRAPQAGGAAHGLQPVGKPGVARKDLGLGVAAFCMGQVAEVRGQHGLHLGGQGGRAAQAAVGVLHAPAHARELVVQVAEHALAHQQVAGPHDVAQKIDAVGHRRQPPGVAQGQGQAQALAQKAFDGLAPLPQLGGVVVQQHEVVNVAQVVAHLEGVLDVLVEFVQIDVGEELAGEVADGQALAVRRVGQLLVRGHAGQVLRAALVGRTLRRIAGEQQARQPEHVAGLAGVDVARAGGGLRVGGVRG